MLRPAVDLSIRLPARFRWRDVAVFALAAGAISALVGYHYGDDNHLEQLPLVLHRLDPGLYANDLLVTADGGRGPRWIWTELLAAGATFAPLPWVCLALTVLGNVAMAFVSAVGARVLFGHDGRTALVAAALTTSVHALWLGAEGFLVRTYCLPAGLATPLACGAVLAGCAGRPVWAAALGAVASLPHPLLGLEAGALGCAVAAAGAVAGPGRHAPDARRTLATSIGALAALIATGWLLWIRPQPPTTLATVDLIAILGRFRAPHHYLPSTFPTDEFVLAAALCGASALAWLRWWRAPGADRVLAARVAIAGGCITAAFLAGWLCVEVWPVRLVFVAQTFRLVFALKWLALLLLAHGAIVAWRMAPDRPMAAGAVLSLAGIGRVQPAVALAGQAVVHRLARGGLEPAARRRWAWAAAVVVAVGTAAGSPREAALLALLGGMAWWLSAKPRRLVALVAPLAVAAAVVAGLFALRAHPLPFARAVQAKVAPRLDLDETTDPLDGAARWLRDNTPRAAVVLTPPGGGRVRLVAQRAIVVDHRAFPWSDDGLREWFARIQACYGPTGDGADAWYAALDDAARARLAAAYGATHAILAADAPSARPELWRDARWKVIALR